MWSLAAPMVPATRENIKCCIALSMRSHCLYANAANRKPVAAAWRTESGDTFASPRENARRQARGRPADAHKRAYILGDSGLLLEESGLSGASSSLMM